MSSKLLDITGKMYESEALAEMSYGEAFMTAAKDVLTPALEESRLRTDQFIQDMPINFNMAKVDPKLREKLKNYASEAKLEYAEAAKIAGMLLSLIHI